MKIGPLLAHLRELEEAYAESLQKAAGRHEDEADVFHQCLTFAATVDKRLRGLAPLEQRYPGKATWKRTKPEHGSVLLEELRGQYLVAHELAVTWVMALQAAQAARDAELKEVATTCHGEVETQAKWFLTRIKAGAPQELVAG